MWLNSAFSALIGAMLRDTPGAAVFLLMVLMLHLYLKKALIRMWLYGLIILAFFMLNDSKQPELQDFDWDNSQAGVYNGPVILKDHIQIDGEVMTGQLTAARNQLQFNYYIGSEQEQLELKRQLPYFKQCAVQMTVNKVLPSTNGLKFNYDEYLAYQGIHYSAKVKNFDLTQCTDVEISGWDWVKWYRVKLADQMMKLPFSKMSYVVALTLGDTRYLSTEALAELKTLGIYHLYAVSGSHVAMLTVQLLFILKRLYLPVIHSTAVILLLLPSYALLTGFSPSVLRASLFIALYMMLKRWNFSLLDSLALSFIIFLIYDIHLIHDIGFQLSYIISFVLIFTGSLFHHRPPLMIFVYTTFFAQLASLPVLLLHFNTVQWSGFITNLLFVPFFTFLLFPVCTMLLLATMFFNWQPPLLLDLLTTLFQVNDYLVTLFKGLHIPETVLSNQWEGFYILIVVMVYYAVHLCYHSRVNCFIAMSSVCLFIICWSFLPKDEDRVTFVDVGQGDSTMIESRNKVMVIDTGGQLKFDDEPWKQRHKDSSIADFSIIPMLTERGYSRIDYLLLTHPDQDHFGEAVQLLQKFNVKNLIINPGSPGNEKYKKTLMTARNEQTKIIDIREFQGLNVGRAQVVFMNTDSQSADENDSSIVTSITLGKLNYLLMADLPAEREQQVTESLYGVKIDVIKVGHHGSDTSTTEELLDCVQPTYAVISAGRKNRFGHPHASVVQRLKSNGIQIMSTQQLGKIEFKDHQFMTGKMAIKKARQ
ncbi:DNA internalization-related competence protein ComEC/Rec2 [Macrococcus lamae]|uniref:DNA internalization-related competence protein ComEC/Rec2 n=1 Tax=Macrococcus lamae TaxID=198484 RepID=A0A4R6BXY2_9STAP|nr:DNA internalization-related competence protein ComEC/Rec2 [Macrococcus lamae]TDM13090.1 DNA internalization-related competence protein ComEC/Rec2 [Macrococcus lamae]